MAFEHFSYDPLTGITTLFDYDDDANKAILHRVQDCEGLLEVTKAHRNSGSTREVLKRDDYFCLHSMIPALIEVELLKKGISLNNPDDSFRLIQEIETNYPYLKCTDLKLWRPT